MSAGLSLGFPWLGMGTVEPPMLVAEGLPAPVCRGNRPAPAIEATAIGAEHI
jgi:hypothetical protein